MKKFTHVLFVAGMFALMVAACDTGTTDTDPIDPPDSPPRDPMSRTIKGVEMIFWYVPDGSFQRDDKPGNISTITKAYWMAETPVTQELFQAVMGINPSLALNGSAVSPPADGEIQEKRPVENVSWYHAIAFCNKMSLADGKEPVYRVKEVSDWESLTFAGVPTAENANWNAAQADWDKDGYRLPTEMEWMWAAMGANKSAQPNITGYKKDFAGCNGTNDLENYAWYEGNVGAWATVKTHQVGKKLSNELGIYDMSGNVWELCWDWKRPYPNGQQTDFRGGDEGALRAVRGGSWSAHNYECAVASRGAPCPNPSYRGNNIGFRVVCP